MERKWEGSKEAEHMEEVWFRPTMTESAKTLENIKLCNGEKKGCEMWKRSHYFQDLPCVNGCLWKPFLAQLLVPGCKPTLRQLAPSCSSRAFV